MFDNRFVELETTTYDMAQNTSERFIAERNSKNKSIICRHVFKAHCGSERDSIISNFPFAWTSTCSDIKID